MSTQARYGSSNSVKRRCTDEKRDTTTLFENLYRIIRLWSGKKILFIKFVHIEKRVLIAAIEPKQHYWIREWKDLFSSKKIIFNVILRFLLILILFIIPMIKVSAV